VLIILCVNEQMQRCHGCMQFFFLKNPKMLQLAKLNSILSFTTVKGFNCQVCAQAKQRRKSHTTAEVSNLVPLELIHSGICGMNDG
jgi:hypothetical protein